MDVTVQGTAGQSGTNDGGPSASGTNGQPGQDASAVANNATDTSNGATANGGRGGAGGIGNDASPPGSGTGGNGGNGAAGGNAAASATTTTAASGFTYAIATANGGTGGEGAEGGPLNGLGGSGGNGGDADGASAVNVNTAGAAYASATEFGGTGGPSAGDTQANDLRTYQGRVYPGGNGGAVANITASAIGLTSATASADQNGGAGDDGPKGGTGAASSLTNAVTGSTTDGTLSLGQLAQGGAGGGGFAGVGGQAGAATSELTFDDTASPTQSAMVAVNNDAVAGVGGIGALGGVNGADASSDSNITGAHDIRISEYTIGGGGGASGAAIVANAGGRAGNGGDASGSASAITTSATGNVAVDLSVSGGFGGNAEDGSYDLAVPGDGGDGGKATIGLVSGAGGASADVEATLAGGVGGTSDGGLGGTGADASLINAVQGTTQGGNLTLDETATGGDGGDSFGGTGGQGGSAVADLTDDDTAQAHQSAFLEVEIQAQAGEGGFDQIGANPGLDQVGQSRQLTGDGGSAEAHGTVIAAPTLSSGTATIVNLQVSAAGNRGVTGGDATADATATGGTVNVASYATAGSGLEQSDFALDRSGTATADATATDAGGYATAQARSGLANAIGSDVSEVSGTAQAMVFGTTTVHAVAGYNQVGSFDTGAEAVADVIGLPSAAMGGTDVGAAETLLFDAEQGSSGLPGPTGSQTTTTTVSVEVDLTQFNTGSEFLLDLHQAKVIGDGVTGVTFDLTGLDTAPVHEVFTNAASAAAYFTDDVIDLGSFDTVTDDGDALYLSMSLSVTTDDAGSGFYAEVEGAGMACYCAGTRIATAQGEVAVEELRVGDEVMTLTGRAPIVWIGRRRVHCRHHTAPETVHPVRIRAHAFGAAPVRDLLLSPDHAVWIDGALVPALLLVDGDAIVQEAHDVVSYFHVELERHGVIFAEGLTAESYLDTGNRSQFANAPLVSLHPTLGPGEEERDPCAPVVLDGPRLTAVRERRIAMALEQQPAWTTGPLAAMPRATA